MFVPPRTRLLTDPLEAVEVLPQHVHGHLVEVDGARGPLALLGVGGPVAVLGRRDRVPMVEASRFTSAMR
jgi:hypothetical protein